MKLISFLDAAPRSPFARMLWVVAACGVVTLLAWPWRDLLDPANTAMLYVLAVAVVAVRPPALPRWVWRKSNSSGT